MKTTQIIQLWVLCIYPKFESIFLPHGLELKQFLLQIFVGNLDSNVTDEHLRQVFSQYGELVHVKIPAGKRCGFVQFADRYVNLFVMLLVMLVCEICA